MPTLQFKGKASVWNHHLAIPYHTLEEVQDLDFQREKGDGNLIVEGDNLLALKALLPQYAGKVKCIYIDPPYNTGHEGWTYDDSVNSPLLRNWLGRAVGSDDLTRHDKWLCMMTPRLKLLRELLHDEGALFISIDDNEHHHLRILCDEIFGADGFVADIVWRSADSSNHDAQRFSADYNYTLVYARSDLWRPHRFKRTESDNAHYSNPDNDPRGPWFAGNLSSPNPRANLRYSVTSPSGGKIESPPQWLALE